MSTTRSRTSRSCSGAEGPSPSVDTRVALAARRNPETRTWKNSSRLDEKMARNFTRSSNGFRSSDASYSTRALNSIHDCSRPRCGTRLGRARRTRCGAVSCGRLSALIGARECTSRLLSPRITHSARFRHRKQREQALRLRREAEAGEDAERARQLRQVLAASGLQLRLQLPAGRDHRLAVEGLEAVQAQLDPRAATRDVPDEAPLAEPGGLHEGGITREGDELAPSRGVG